MRPCARGDRRGLLKARRTTSGVRVFAREEIERLREQRDRQPADAKPRLHKAESEALP